MTSNIQNPKILRVWAITDVSPIDVSLALSKLRISHTRYMAASEGIAAAKEDIKLGFSQPAWPVVMDSVDRVYRYDVPHSPQVVFICATKSVIAQTNLDVLDVSHREIALRDALSFALSNPMDTSWTLVVKDKTTDDYVNEATKPTLLNHIQTALYKISPHELKKEVQKLVIGYLAGKETKTKLFDKLKSSYKLDTLKDLMSDPQIPLYKEAVNKYRATGDMDAVVAEFGFASFEILYVINSVKKAEDDERKAKLGLLPKRGRPPKSDKPKK